MLKKSGAFLFLTLIALYITTGCRQKLSTAAYDAQLLIPIAKTSLNIYNLLPDTAVTKDSTNLLSLVYRSNLYSYNKTTEIVIPDTTIQYNFKLDSIKLSDKSLNYRYSLGQLAKGLGLLGGGIIAANYSYAPLPSFTDNTPSNFDIDARSFFKYAILRHGFMDLSLVNNYPVELDTIRFELRDKVSKKLILKDSIIQLPVGSTFSKTYDLSGDTVEGLLVGSITHLYTPGSGGGTVLIDTSKGLDLSMKVYAMKVQQATAIFPAQNLVTDSADAPYNITGGVRLKYVILKHGGLTIKAVSTIKDTLHFEYTLPYVTDTNGKFIYIKDIVPPAGSSGNTSIKRFYDLTGFKVDLTGKKHDTANTFSHSLVLRIDSTGIERSLSLNDSLYIYYSLDSLIPKYAEGNLGTDTVTLKGGTHFNFLNRVKSGTINLKDVNVNVSITNYIGAIGNIKINSISGSNSSTGKTVPLTSSVFNTPINVTSAAQAFGWLNNNKLDYTKLNPSYTALSVNGSNSNITSVFNILPDSLRYNITTVLNPNNNPNNFSNFIYSDRSLNVNLDIKVPLSLMANGLTLMDTVNANLQNLAFQANSNRNGITDAVMYLIVSNGFPIKSQVQVYFYTSNYTFIDSLFSTPQIVQAAPTNTTCYVSAPLQTVLQTELTPQRLDKLKTGTHAIVKTIFNTVGTGKCNGQPLNLYSDYNFNVTLSARLKYHFAKK